MPPVRTSAAEVNQSQIDVLGERIDKQFDKVMDMLQRYEERLRGLENREAGCSPLMSSRVNAAWAKIDTHEIEIGNLKKSVDALLLLAQRQESIIKWAAGILAVIIAAGAIYLLGRLIYLAITHG